MTRTVLAVGGVVVLAAAAVFLAKGPKNPKSPTTGGKRSVARPEQPDSGTGGVKAGPPTASRDSAPNRKLDAWLARARAELPGEHPGDEGFTRLREELIRLFEEDPANLQKAIEAIFAEPKLPGFGEDLIIEAVALYRDTAVAHEHLCRLLVNPKTEDSLKPAIISSLSWAAVPPEATTRFLLRLAKIDAPIALDALDCLGRIAGQLRETDRRRADQIVAELEATFEMYARAGNTQGTAVTLEVLGRAGGDGAREVIRRSLESENADIRAAALRGSGALNSEERYAVAVRYFQTDSDLSVRMAAVEAMLPDPRLGMLSQAELNDRIPSEVIEVLRRVLETERSVDLRMKVLEFFYVSFDLQRPPPAGVLDTLRRLAESDESEKVRGRAEFVLHNLEPN